MTSKELQKKLSSLAALKASGEPNALWATETRAMLLEKISAETSSAPVVVSTQETIKLPRVGFFPNFMFAMRPVMVVVMIFGFGAFGYFGSMGAIASALPGNSLYGVKTMTERAQLTFAANDDARVILHAEFVSRRASEVAALAESGSKATDEKVALAVANLTDEMKTVGVTMQAVKSEYGSGAAAIAKVVDRKAAEVRAILGKTKGLLAANSQKQIESAENIADELSLQAVAVLAVSPDDIKTDDLKNRVQGNIDVAKQKLEIATPEGEEQIEAAKAAKAALTAAQKAADSDDYVEAVAKVQEAAALTAEKTEDADEPAEPTDVDANANVNAPANVNVNEPTKIKAIDQ